MYFSACKLFFPPRSVYCSYNQNNNRVIMGQKRRELLVGSGQVCAGASMGPSPRQAFRGWPGCLSSPTSVLVEAFLYPRCHPATSCFSEPLHSKHHWLLFSPSILSLPHSGQGFVPSSLLKWLLTYLFTCLLFISILWNIISLKGKARLHGCYIPILK